MNRRVSVDKIEQGVARLQAAIVKQCVQNGGSCNIGADGQMTVNATFDPAEVVRAVLAHES
jgi:hypothetical protein